MKKMDLEPNLISKISSCDEDWPRPYKETTIIPLTNVENLKSKLMGEDRSILYKKTTTHTLNQYGTLNTLGMLGWVSGSSFSGAHSAYLGKLWRDDPPLAGPPNRDKLPLSGRLTMKIKYFSLYLKFLMLEFAKLLAKNI